jgi:hypothetical protein
VKEFERKHSGTKLKSTSFRFVPKSMMRTGRAVRGPDERLRAALYSPPRPSGGVFVFLLDGADAFINELLLSSGGLRMTNQTPTGRHIRASAPTVVPHAAAGQLLQRVDLSVGLDFGGLRDKYQPWIQQEITFPGQRTVLHLSFWTLRDTQHEWRYTKRFS